MKFARVNVFHHASSMLLHYFGKLKVQICCKFGGKCIQDASISTYTHFIVYRLFTYYLLTYCFCFWFLLNIPWNIRRFYANMPTCYQRSAHRACVTVDLKQATPLSFDQICSHWIAPILVWSTTRQGASSSSKFVSHGCTTLIYWSYAWWAFQVRLALTLTTVSVTVQLTSGGINSDHACKQIIKAWANRCDIINILLTTWHVMFHFCHTW